MDEPLLTPGRELELPPWLEPTREQIAAKRPVLPLPDDRGEQGWRGVAAGDGHERGGP